MTDLSPKVSPVEVVDLLGTLRSFGVELILSPQAEGVVLEGVSRSYYGKQMAQELVRKRGLAIVANRIVVNRWQSTSHQTLENRTS